MPTPTIPDGELFFNATTYTGNGSTQTITNGNSGQSFQPDFLWVKERSEARSNLVWDSVRGSNLGLITNTTSSESAQPSFTGFVSNGFGVSNADSSDITNKNAQTYVAWQWKAGGTAVTNTAGTISSQVSANTTSGFSVVTYTGTGANATVGHGLGVAPKMIFVKDRTQGGTYRDWAVYNADIGAGNALFLNDATGSFSKPSYWNSTTATSSVFSLGSDITVNQSGDAYVAYCWTPIAGYSAFGSYTGNGSADGPFVYLGFRPRFVMIKRTDSTSTWGLIDTARDTYNVTTKLLFANTSAAENTSYTPEDILSNGFKLRDTTYNISSGTYIYMAFAENPFKYANAR